MGSRSGSMSCLTTICATRSATVGTPKIRCASTLLRNGDGAHRRRKVASRAHPVPDLVEIALQVGFELLDRLPIHTGRTRIGFDRFVRFVHSPLIDIERLVCRIASTSSCFQLFRSIRPPDPTPLLQPHYRAFIATTGRSAPVLRFGTLASRFSPLVLLPWHRSDWFLQFRAKACVRFTPPLRRSPSAQSSGSRRTCPRRATRPWF